MELPKRQIYRIKDVVHAYGLSRSTIWRLLASPSQNFPTPIKISLRSIGFDADELATWFSGRKLQAAQG